MPYLIPRFVPYLTKSGTTRQTPKKGWLSENKNSWNELKEAMYAPTMCLDLFSVPRMDHIDIRVLIGDQGCTLIYNRSDSTLAYTTLGQSGL